MFFLFNFGVVKRKYPDINIPNFEELSKLDTWDIKLYQPMVYNEEVIRLSETLRPGSIAYDDFWDEMDYYCIRGYKPKGMPRITGKHFFYLNFCQIELLKKGARRKTKSNPFYRDLDHWLFLELEAAQKYGYGIIIGKPRRVGLSEWGALVVHHELKFHQGSKAAIAAGKEDKAQDFYDKLKYSFDNVHPAYSSGLLARNSDDFRLGYKERVNKQDRDKGLLSFAKIKTMYSDESAFEGGQYSVAIFEEAGLFEKLLESYKATKPCFQEGAIQYGVPLIYGTGGNMDGSSSGYKKLKEQAVIHNLKPILVPANMYFPGDGVPDEKTGKSISFFNYETGVTNREAALEYINQEKKIAQLSKETFIKHIQTYPMSWEDVFMQNKGGYLDLPKLNYQNSLIERGLAPEPVLRGRLEWEDTDETKFLLSRAKNLKEKTKIRVSAGSAVKFVVDPDGNMYKDSNPINKKYESMGYKPDIGGCDSYDEEADEDNNLSSGAIMAYRLFINPLYEYDKPVGVLFDRGSGNYDDDTFYEAAVMFAIYWDIEVLVEYSKILIIRYFYDVGAGKHIRQKPEIEEINSTNHKNKDGLKMTGVTKKYGTKLLKNEVSYNIHKCWIKPIILDLMKYGIENTDISMAYVMCLYHKLDLFPEISEDLDVTYTSFDQSEPHYSYYIDMNGNLRTQESGNMHLDRFIPERDLSRDEFEKHLREKENKENQALELHKKHKNEGNSLDESILRMIIEEQKRFS